MLEAALEYASRAWPVLPLRPNQKTPLTTHGLLDASDEAKQLKQWWKEWPTANIGLRTGITFDVLDLDGPQGLASFQELAPGYKHPGPASTTGKGYHLLFQTTGAKNGANLLEKVDFRGLNGYIVAPPSIHPSGAHYTWAKDKNLPLPEAPYWLLDLVFPPKIESKGTSPVANALASALDLRQEFEAIGVHFQNRGSRLSARCPFHEDDTPSLVLYPNETFYCFGCTAWGDALNVRNYSRTGTLR